jgi:hypothetical protein
MNGFANPEPMYLESFGGVEVFRPRLATELEVRAAAERHLRLRFNTGRYFDKDEINAILRHNFAFYCGVLEEVLPQIASIQFLEFVLFQFEQYTRVDQLQRNGGLSLAQDERWSSIGPNLRRGTKYLAERLCFLQPDQTPQADEDDLLTLSEQAWICAEQVIDLYMQSDLAFITFPGQTTLEIFPPGHDLYMHQEIVADCPDIRARVRLDAEERDRFVPDAPILSDLHEHNQFIGDDVRNCIGLSYRDAVGVLADLITRCAPAPDGFPIPLVHKATAIDRLAAFLHFPTAAVERALSGFTISPAQMEAEQRELWQPNREYRAYRRGFFEVPHPTGDHFIFSPAMAGEAFLIFSREAVFGQFPQEWRSEAVNRSLGRLSNEAGRWFERVVEDNCRAIGFVGRRSAKERLGEGQARIEIPQDIGEIDLIAYSQREELLLILECKLVRYSFEARYFRNDISDFALARRSYAEKFRRKVEWMRDNLEELCRAIASQEPLRGVRVTPNRIACAMITLYPTMATCFINDMPCVSIAELMIDYASMNRWPYELGMWRV